MAIAHSNFCELSPDEGRVLLDEATQRVLGMSAEDFIDAWDNGQVDRDDPAVVDLALLLPFGR